MEGLPPYAFEMPTNFHTDAEQCHSANPRLAVRIAEACRLIGIGRPKFYEMIAAREIEVIKVGAITLVSMAELKRFLASRRVGASEPGDTRASDRVEQNVGRSRSRAAKAV